MRPLSPGALLGPYEILSPIGAGGMGEVWKARDTRLGRTVAVKILPPEFASDIERRRRFELEARAVATLNHPNIVALFDVGDFWVVTEFLDGEPLRAIIGSLSLRRTLDIAQQTAQGLAAAHGKGIVHRDLKPENIFLLTDGRVKILDFGLAKPVTPVGSDQSTLLMDVVNSSPGQVMGSVGYMSPEQIRGQAVDHRSDIFSFGLVLYEMLSGHRAFRGATSADTMSAVLTADAPELPIAVPPATARIVHRCLEKEPARRFQSAADLGFALESLSTISTASMPGLAPSLRPSRRNMLWAGGSAAIAAAGFAAGYWLRPREPEPPRFRQIPTPPGTPGTAGAIHPDGRSIVYTAIIGGESHVFHQYLEGGPSRDLELPDGSEPVAISVQGELAFIADQVLYRTPLANPAPRAVIENVSYAAWSPDGGALLVNRKIGDHYRIEYPIGSVLYATDARVRAVCLSRRTNRIAFIEFTRDAGPQLLALDSSRQKIVLYSIGKDRGVYLYGNPFWSLDEREVWASPYEGGDHSALEAYGLNGKRRTVTRLPGILYPIDISPRGDVLMNVGAIESRVRVAEHDSGSEREVPLDARVFAISRDGRTLILGAVRDNVDRSDIYLYKLDGSAPVLLGPGYPESTVLSPDGKWVHVQRETDAFLMPTGAGEEQKVQVPGLESPSIYGWLPDGKRMLVWGRIPNQPNGNLYVWQPGAKPARLLSDERLDGLRVAPDGTRFVAYGTSRKWFVSSVDNSQPVSLAGIRPNEAVFGWTGDSRALYVGKQGTPNTVIDRYALDTGTRTKWKEFSSGRPDATVRDFVISSEGGYGYSVIRLYRRLILAEGLR